MADRYFVDSPVHGRLVRLTGQEAQHLARVKRAVPGTQIVLFDGGGAEFPARVEKLGRHEVLLSIESRCDVDRELPVELTLAVALPKGDRQKWLIEKAVELGVRRIVPLRTARSIAQPVEQALARLRRTVIEASKQCGRNRLMEITEPVDWGRFAVSASCAGCRLLAHYDPGGTAAVDLGSLFRSRRMDCSAEVVAAVGPEGGFAPDEVSQALAAAWQPVDLGPRVLRVCLLYTSPSPRDS